MSFETFRVDSLALQRPAVPPVPDLVGAGGPAALVAEIGAASFSAQLAAALKASAPATPCCTAAAATPAPAFPPADAGLSAMPVGGGAPATYPNLTGDLDASPAILSRLDRMAAARGERWTVTSGLRTDAEQAELWANRASNPYPVARPGTSIHRTGQGADVTIGGRPIQDVISAEALRAEGLEPLAGDAVHVQLAGTLS